jgi:hypothetical protein
MNVAVVQFSFVPLRASQCGLLEVCMSTFGVMK